MPEWEFEALRNFLVACNEQILPLRVIDFYANYKVYITQPICWRKMILHRNIPEVEFWGDGANVKLQNQPFDWGQLPLQFTVHHFGSVRHAARLREKWHIQGKMYGKGRRLKVPKFAFNLFPYKWINEDCAEKLAIYDGPFIQAVRENPDEFVRDNFAVLKHLQQKAETAAATTA